MKHKTTNILRLTNIARKNIQREKLFHSWHNLLITLSGGQDSAFCLLVLYLLKDKSKKKMSFYTLLAKASLLHPPLCIKRQNNLLWHEKDQITEFYLTFSFVTNYTLLWCNHFWQKDAFFTMEHVSKLAFSKKYTIHLFAPVQKVFSEQEARYWRHKIMQRSSFFTCQPKFCYELQQSSKEEKKLKQYLSAGFLQIKPAFASKKTTNSAQTFLRAQMSPKLQSGQFITLFLSFVLLARPLLSTLTNNQSSTLVKQSTQNYITNTTFGQSELLCVQGHNKSDRAEAILFNLIRGAGINGISTLQWKQSLSKSVLQNEVARAQTRTPPLQKAAAPKLWYSSKKAKFYSANDVFYPILSDFLKEIPIIYLDVFRFKEDNLKKKDKQNNFLRLAILQKIDFQQHCSYSRIQRNGYTIQSKAVNFQKGLRAKQSFAFLRVQKHSFCITSFCIAKTGLFVRPGCASSGALFYTLKLYTFKQAVKTNINKKTSYSKKANLYYKQANLHKMKVKTKMFYYQLKYKQDRFFCC